MSNADISELAQHTEDCYQTILISDRVNVLAIESETNLYQWIHVVNQMNEFCNEYKQAISENKLKLHSTKLKNVEIIDNILF